MQTLCRRLADGSAAALRTMHPHDARALQALIEGLSPRDRRWRFHGAITGVTPARGLRWLHGTTLADNTPMLELLRSAGFLCVPNRRDPNLVNVEACLQAPAVAGSLLH